MHAVSCAFGLALYYFTAFICLNSLSLPWRALAGLGVSSLVGGAMGHAGEE